RVSRRRGAEAGGRAARAHRLRVLPRPRRRPRGRAHRPPPAPPRRARRVPRVPRPPSPRLLNRRHALDPTRRELLVQTGKLLLLTGAAGLAWEHVLAG